MRPEDYKEEATYLVMSQRQMKGRWVRLHLLPSAYPEPYECTSLSSICHTRQTRTLEICPLGPSQCPQMADTWRGQKYSSSTIHRVLGKADKRTAGWMLPADPDSTLCSSTMHKLITSFVGTNGNTDAQKRF